MKIKTFVLISLVIFAFLFCGYNVYLIATHPLKFKEEIITCSKIYNLNAEVIASLINVESSFNRNARSNKNAIGLVQIKLSTANYLNDLNNEAYITEETLFKPEINIKYGCQYLKYLMNKFKNLNTSLAAYNAGETIVRSWLKSGVYSVDGKILSYIPYKETREYVEKVNKNIKYYSKKFH